MMLNSQALFGREIGLLNKTHLQALPEQGRWLLQQPQEPFHHRLLDVASHLHLQAPTNCVKNTSAIWTWPRQRKTGRSNVYQCILAPLLQKASKRNGRQAHETAPERPTNGITVLHETADYAKAWELPPAVQRASSSLAPTPHGCPTAGCRGS